MKAFRGKTPPPAPAWHADFRDPATLPDVKVIRTAFFVNGVSVLILMVVALFFAYQEFGRFSLRGEIKLLEERIQQNSQRNEQVLKLHGDFEAEERYIKEVIDYLDGSLNSSAILIALAETLHPDMLFTAIRYQRSGLRGEGPKQLILNGSIWATPDAAATAITDYLGSFHQHEILASRVKEAVPTSLVPTPEGDRMAFGIQLLLEEGAPEKKEDKK